MYSARVESGTSSTTRRPRKPGCGDVLGAPFDAQPVGLRLGVGEQRALLLLGVHGAQLVLQPRLAASNDGRELRVEQARHHADGARGVGDVHGARFVRGREVLEGGGGVLAWQHAIDDHLVGNRAAR